MSSFSGDKPILAVDAALGGCTAAVLLPDGKIVTRAVETEREQAAILVPMVQEAMEEAGAAFADLGLIVTSVGPGSFTGLRIGLSAARAWGLALSIPVQGVGTMEAMARSCAAEHAKGYAVLLETKRTDYYFQTFDSQFLPLRDGACADIETAVDVIRNGEFRVCGDALARFEMESGVKPADACARRLLDPAVLARAGLDIFIRHGGKADTPTPLYLRGADVSMSNKKQREIQNNPL